MSESEPFFPPPGTKETKKEPAGPYRNPDSSVEKAALRPSERVRLEARRPSKPPAEDAIARGALIEAIVAARAQQKRNAVIALVFGIALSIGGVVVTFMSRGQMIWYGAVVAGVLMMFRAVMLFVRLSVGQD